MDDEQIPEESEQQAEASDGQGEIVLEQSPLDQFSYSIRHRVEKPFVNGEYEGRLRLAVGEYIVSSATLDGVLAQMTVKADSLITNGSKVQG